MADVAVWDTLAGPAGPIGPPGPPGPNVTALVNSHGQAIADLDTRQTSVEGGSGAVPLKSRMARNVKDYGAIGDGASHPLSAFYGSLAAAQAVYPHAASLTDEIDWAAWAAAKTATGWPANEGAITVPPGSYRFSPTNVFTLDGAGASATPRFTINARGVRLYAEGDSAIPQLKITNNIVSTTFVHVLGLQFVPNAVRTAVLLNNAQLCVFDGCDFGSASGSTAVEVNGVSSGNRFVGCGFFNLRRAFYLNGCADFLIISGCHFHEGLLGSPLNWIEQISGVGSGGVVINGCFFYGLGGTLPLIRNLNGSGWVIQGNYFERCAAAPAIWLAKDGGKASITGNTFRWGGQHDIVLNGAMLCAVANNVFGVRDPYDGAVPADTYSNVRIIDPFGIGWGSRNTITGNTSEDTAGALDKVVKADASCQNLYVVGNVGAAGFDVLGAGSVVSNITA